MERRNRLIHQSGRARRLAIQSQARPVADREEIMAERLQLAEAKCVVRMQGWLAGQPRSSITELSFHGINTPREMAKSVTDVSGTIRYLCVRVGQ